ncbi:MAG TPA: hypothetical protein PLH57_04905 [Oligoflexia bacterium]|nr:hypothetical protein [Oligoflexia bacterium]
MGVAPKQEPTVSFRTRVLVICALFCAIVPLAGCTFFGKQVDENANLAVGQISGGQSILGSWTFSFAQATATNNPSDAQNITYSFEPNSVLRVEVRNPHYSGFLCTGYGQYRIAGRDVFAYVQAESPQGCGFSSFTHLGAAEVGSQRIVFTSPDGAKAYYFKTRFVPTVSPVGLWDFQGDGGFDWIYFDHNGYFILQTTYESEMYLMVGYFSVAQNGVTLVFFDNLDPASVSTAPIIFDQFMTDGFTLDLIEQTDAGPVTYHGIRL